MDFLLTCPPYWNLEKYDGGPGDLSMIGDYKMFFEQLAVVVRESYRLLKPDAYSCWVIGLHRYPDGTLAPLHHSLSDIHAQAGFRLQEEIILAHKNNGAIQRVGNFERGNKRLIRTHEYVMVFKT
jgi:DNA modification methylase